MSGKAALEIAGGVAVIRFSNPPEGFMDDGTEAALAEALDRIEADASVRVAVLTGADPGVFIRHYDVRLLEARGRDLRARGLSFTTDRPVPEPPLHLCMRRIEASPIPFIAALNGTAMGGGFELALACDIRLAEAGPCNIGLPEVRIGVLPGAGGTQRLPRLIGEARALEFILRGRAVGPREAATLGLVSECVEGPVLDRAMSLAKELAGRPARALAHVKRLVRRGPDAEGLADERTLFCDLMVSDEALELMGRMNRGKWDILDP